MRRSSAQVDGVSEVQIRLLPRTAQSEVSSVWNALEARFGDGALTCSWDWTESWVRHYADVVPVRFAIGERGGTPCGVALVTEPVVQLGGPLTIRELHLGTSGESLDETVYVEYNRLLVDPQAREPFIHGLLAAIDRDRRWDELRLTGFVPDDAVLLLANRPAMHARRVACPAVDLRQADEVGGQVLDLLKSSTRQKIRRSLKGLGPIEVEWAETEEQALDVLEELIALHQARWNAVGKPGAFASPRSLGFHRELVPRLHRSGAAILFRASAGGVTLGCLYAFVERGAVLFYQGGLASFEDNRVKPGLVMHALCMQACRDRGLTEYNLLAGDERYKHELATITRELVWASQRRPRLKFRLIDGLRRARRWQRELRGSRGASPA